jgi:hypothetical protein
MSSGAKEFVVNVRDSHVQVAVVELSPDTCGEYNEEEATIHLNRDLSGVMLLDTAIHEFIHAYLPDLKEETVTEMATQLTKLVIRLSGE